jgi:hypothetical protein
MPLTNDDLAMLLSALAQTPQFQFLDQLMAQQDPGPEAGEDPGMEPGAEEVPEGMGEEAPPEAGPDDDLGDVQDLLVDEGGDEGGEEAPAEEAHPEEAPPEDEPTEKNILPAIPLAIGGAGATTLGTAATAGAGAGAAGAAAPVLATAVPPVLATGAGATGAGAGVMGAGKAYAGKHLAMAGGAGYMAGKRSMAASGQQPARYAQLRNAHNKLVQEHGRLASRMQGLIREKTDAERNTAIQLLGRKYPDFVDVASELKAVLYSQKSTMDDASFKTHCTTIEKYAQKASQVARSQRGDIPMGGVDRQPRDEEAEKYQMRLSSEAVQIYTAALGAGKQMTYDEAKQAAVSKLSPK